MTLTATTLAALLLFAGFPANCVVLDGRDPATIPKLDVPEPPKWEDVEHPPFESYPIEAGELEDNAVLEQFDGTEEEVFARWKVSEAEREPGVKYTAEWALQEPENFKGFDNDRGLVLVSENSFGAIARKFDNPIDTTSGTKPFVLQYETKTAVRPRCSGGYIKVLPTTAEFDYSLFNGETPYLVMFGPDVCGSTHKVHLILRRNGVEHHLVQPPHPKVSVLSALYTLIIQPNLDFEIRVDGAVRRSGNLLDTLEFDPPLVPPRTIPDATATKPLDWDDREYIPSPEETEKPEDWDETEPRLISDPDAVKPAKWREDIPLFVPDPESTKPANWDDEEDGEFKPRQILNPKCANLNEEAGEGCGEWVPPLVKNPKYKGQWTQPLVPNPDYQGYWKPPQIPNPEFDEEKLASELRVMDADVGGIGFEILSVQGMSMFDNIYIGNSVRDAENIGNATWVPKYLIEDEAYNRAVEAHQNAAAEVREATEKKLAGVEGEQPPLHPRALVDYYSTEFNRLRAEPVKYSADTYNNFRDALVEDKLTALRTFPVTAIVAATVLTLLTSLFFGTANALRVLLTKPKQQKKKAEAKPEAKPETKPETE